MSPSAFSDKAKALDCSAIRLRMHEMTQLRIHYDCERVWWRCEACASHLGRREPAFTALSADLQPEQPSPEPIYVVTAPKTLWAWT